MPISALDRTVIHLAASPRERMVPAGRVARWLQLLFGHPAPNPLANPRLEVLRQLAVHLHSAQTREVPTALLDRCIDAGWLHDEIPEIVAFVWGDDWRADPDTGCAKSGPLRLPSCARTDEPPIEERSMNGCSLLSMDQTP